MSAQRTAKNGRMNPLYAICVGEVSARLECRLFSMTEATIEARATIPIYDAAGLSAASEQALAEARRRLAVIAGLPLEAVTPESVLDSWDGMAMMLEDA